MDSALLRIDYKILLLSQNSETTQIEKEFFTNSNHRNEMHRNHRTRTSLKAITSCSPEFQEPLNLSMAMHGQIHSGFC